MIGVLVYPDFQLLDAAGPITVFETASIVWRVSKRAIRTIAVSSRSGAQFLRCRIAGAGP